MIFRSKGTTDRELADIRHMKRMSDRCAEKIKEPPFAGLFSERFGERWKATAREHLEGHRAQLLLQRSILSKLADKVLPWRSELV